MKLFSGDQVYDWKRFWYPRGTNVNLSSWYYWDAPEFLSGFVPFESIAKTPCLVLLGEPGIGKSFAMRTESKTVDAKVEKGGGKTIWLDLHSYGSEDRLVRALFENQIFGNWLKGTYKLHLFLDSLDECLLRIDTVAEILGDELKKYPLERLYLRIACRTADWPANLERNLQQLWGENTVGVYELAPLRREDIAKAALANDLAPDIFLSEIDQMDIAPLAIKPVTLDFLLNTYKQHGKFPSKQTELYNEGCRLLCEEINESRRGAKRVGTLTADERMIVASRIAAITVFANKAAVWIDVDRGNVSKDDVAIRTLSGGVESWDNDQLQVTEAAIREALSTGLFSSRGPNRIGWAHQTYAEFLAAKYLVEHNTALPQVMSLVTVPGDLGRRVVPQLYETTAWLAGMDPNVFRQVTSIDPLALLRSDVKTVSERDRKALVSHLLELYDKEQLADHFPEVRRYYSKLAHPSLAEQLRPYIVDSAKGTLVRRIATDIAEACELKVLQDELVQIILDSSQPRLVRVNAAYAICRIGDDAAKGQLKPLALGQAGSDPDDELKGCGLLATWPHHLRAEELFAILTAPKKASFLGSYSSFLLSDFVHHLRPSDLPIALKWTEEQSPSHMIPPPFSKLVDAIMLRAWEELDVPEVLDAFAYTVLSRFKRFEPICPRRLQLSPLEEHLRNDVQKRRMLVDTLIPMFSDSNQERVLFRFLQSPLVTSHDLLWMLDRFQAAKSQKARAVWERLIESVFYKCEPQAFDVVFKTVQESPLLSQTFGRLIEPVPLNSPVARHWREIALTSNKREEQLKNRPTLEVLPSERIAELLNECESGNITAWWQLNYAMDFYDDGRRSFPDFNPDVTTLPGWEASGEETRRRIVETAKQYVLQEDPKTSSWLGTNTIYRPAWAGYRALSLLLQHDEEFVLTLLADVWRKWAPTILASPRSFGFQDNRRQILIKLAYRYAPAEFIEALMILIDKEVQDNGAMLTVQEIGNCWDPRLARALLDKAKSGTLEPQGTGQLLDYLLKHQFEKARLFAESLVPTPLPSGGEEREKAIVAARSLVRHTIDSSWPIVWSAIQQDAEFGQEVIQPIADGSGRYSATVGQRLLENQLADLYIWLSRKYPHSEDPPYDDRWQWQAVTPRKNIATWRDSLLHHLVERGTPAACEAIERIIHALPKIQGLKRVLLQAQDVTRRKTWQPSQPADILEIVTDREKQLISSADELAQVLIEALKRLQTKLHGETPAVREVWNRIGKGIYRPIDENYFSDYVKRHLERDLSQRGVIVNREVEIRRGTGKSRGQITDIHVDAVIPGTSAGRHDAVTVIIEVKGCWHSELETAMETQLVNRYLRDNQYQHGIYLVGWFNCDQWDDNDSRKKKAPKKTIKQMQQQFDAQAASLSKQGMHVQAFVMDAALQ